MKIINLDVYRDGGTIKVETDKGDFYIDRRLNFNNDIETIGEVFDDYPKRGNLIPNSNELKKEIYEALKDYDDGFYEEEHVEALRTFIKENTNE
jgi:hypothetical protein